MKLLASCDGGARPKSIDPFGYHLVGCRTGANAIRLHDEVVSMLARLFRCLRVDAIVEAKSLPQTLLARKQYYTSILYL